MVKENRRQFNTWSDAKIFFGYSQESKVYKVYKETTTEVKESSHMIFKENNDRSTSSTSFQDLKLNSMMMMKKIELNPKKATTQSLLKVP